MLMAIAITNIHSSGRLLRNKSHRSPLHSTLSIISILPMHGTEASHHSSVLYTLPLACPQLSLQRRT